MQEVEKILCAAIWYKELPNHIIGAKNEVDKGFVVTGWRHGNVIETVKILHGKRTVQFGPDSVGENIQGFITTQNRFVDRKEAAKIALACKQIEKLNYSSTDLFSEDLY